MTDDAKPAHLPVFDPDYWRTRIAEAGSRVRDAVYANACDARWDEIDALWRAALARHVAADTAILDVGCGYGRLLDLMPSWWRGHYLGLDLSVEFVQLARKKLPAVKGPGRAVEFLVWDMREPIRNMPYTYDLAVCGMVRGMVRAAAPDVWPVIEENVKRCAKNVLYLEVDGEEPE